MVSIMKTEFDNFLIERGYKTFEKSNLDSKYIDRLFQKRFDDDVGKKYFITIKKWEPVDLKWTDEILGPSYEYITQFYFGNENNPVNPVNLDFFGGWDIEDAENKIEELWRAGNFEYYEKWEES